MKGSVISFSFFFKNSRSIFNLKLNFFLKLSEVERWSQELERDLSSEVEKRNSLLLTVKDILEHTIEEAALDPELAPHVRNFQNQVSRKFYRSLQPWKEHPF
jgi:hypothetical protein